MLWITETWLYIGTQVVWAVVILIIFFSRYGNLRLGKQDEKSEYRYILVLLVSVSGLSVTVRSFKALCTK